MEGAVPHPRGAPGPGSLGPTPTPSAPEQLLSGSREAMQRPSGAGRQGRPRTGPAFPPGTQARVRSHAPPSPQQAQPRDCAIQVAAASRKATCQQGPELGRGVCLRPREASSPVAAAAVPLSHTVQPRAGRWGRGCAPAITGSPASECTDVQPWVKVSRPSEASSRSCYRVKTAPGRQGRVRLGRTSLTPDTDEGSGAEGGAGPRCAPSRRQSSDPSA